MRQIFMTFIINIIISAMKLEKINDFQQSGCGSLLLENDKVPQVIMHVFLLSFLQSF